MPKPITELTSEQKQAIDARGTCVALSAGAGCGKTFVLTERFLSHLQPEEDDQASDGPLHRLIAITFTDRAAREMRDRTRAKCYQRLESAAPAQADRWLALIRTLDSARISTIHAFCGALLRSHAVEAGLDPRFVVVEQSQADTLLSEITEDTLREILSSPDSALRQSLLDLLTQFGLERLPRMIAALLSGAGSVDVESWRGRTAREIAEIWGRFCRESVLPRVLREFTSSEPTRGLLRIICQLGEVSGVLRERCDTLSTLIAELPISSRAEADLTDIVSSARVEGAGGKKSWPDDALYEGFKSAAEKVRKLADNAQQFFHFDPAAVEVDAQAGLQLLGISQEVFNRYQRRKEELGWVDFHDLLTMAHRLLTDPAHGELQKRLTAQTQLLLVDECQDTDPLQVELIKALCGKGQERLFFVGDFKQSIYRFRGADPKVFRRLQQETPAAGRLSLTMNFRSQPAILHFVNALFCNALAPENDPELKYEALRARRIQITPTPAIEFLFAISRGQKSLAGAKAAARKQEADFIARRIRGMLDQQEAIVGQRLSDGNWAPRAVKQRDIAILFRTLSDVQFYEERLRHYGIDYYLVGGHAFYAQQEVYDVVNLLRAISSPADLVSLAGVLRSPMFSLTDETLFWLSQHPNGLAGGLHSHQPVQNLDDEQKRRVDFAARTLRQLRSSKDRLSISELLNTALALTGYDAALLGEFMGQRKLANLRKLLDQARAFDQSGVLGVADFIVQLSQFVVEQPREPLAATNPEGTDVVRLMTIHQAKGLEFPAVFVADIGRETHRGDRTAAWNLELGPLVKLARRGKQAAISGIDLHQAMSAAEDRAERFRLFYVATTRAADYLVLSGGLFHSELDSPSSPWLKLLAERFDLRTGQCRADLPRNDAYQAPAVKVSNDAPLVSSAAAESAPRCDLMQVIEDVRSLEKRQGNLQSDTDSRHELFDPVPVDFASRRRFSVSSLNGQLEFVDETASTVPLDDGEYFTIAPSDFGTLAHNILARVDFGKPMEFSETVNQFVAAGDGIAVEHVAAINQMISQFLQSSRAHELGAAKRVYRELEFLLAWPPAAGADETQSGRYLQGVIDCLYQDSAGRWRLIDYKTNRVSAETMPSVAARYQMQMGVYALAVERILREPPVELALHFLRTGGEYSFAWNDAARTWTIETVNHAIEKSLQPF
jgi:ATP-dependent helicase/nuclease subunit A